MTSDAQTIPEDVMKAVQSAWEQAWGKTGSTNAESIRDAIAIGILAERERAAGICSDHIAVLRKIFQNDVARAIEQVRAEIKAVSA
ncbi:hypothetical protein [Sinorhizobium meliloti]|uniref:hypothetical protein n=1 Tax=Rhizobium meliloti TaxID=382 RepID=UPI000FD7FAAD|nr:hypothetical protein [Sinorhizobium meliloti]RVG90393.1 hypothetical protein CN218_23670 [Sinorhizobium meliloti]